MSFKCKIGLHSWKGCKCSDCDKIRDEQHDWNGCKCSKCDKTRDEQHNMSQDCDMCSKCGKTQENQHDWSKDCEKCSKCGKTRKNQHIWNGCKCSKCTKTRDEQHDWNGCKCSKCGLEKHEWKGCKCSKCGKTRDSQHQWKDNKCSICGLATTINLSPGEVVPISGLYYCTMCKHGDSSLRETMIGYARSKGLSSFEIERVLAQAGISAKNEIVKKKFSAGSIFNECPQHKTATGWTLEK